MIDDQRASWLWKPDGEIIISFQSVLKRVRQVADARWKGRKRCVCVYLSVRQDTNQYVGRMGRSTKTTANFTEQLVLLIQK